MDPKNSSPDLTSLFSNFSLGLSQWADWALHVLPAKVEQAWDSAKASNAAGEMKQKYHCEVGPNALFRCSSASSHFEVLPLGAQRELPLSTTEQGLVVFVSGTF